MKKPIALVALLCTLSMGAHADLILHEDFDRTVGTLNQGLVYDMGANTNDWWHNSGGADSIKVVAGSLKYTDYVEENGNKAMILGGAVSTDLRQFAPITSGKVYAAAIINVDSVASATSAGAFFSLGDAETGTYAKLHCYQSGEGFKLAVTKNNEGSNEIDYTTDVYNTKTDYFVVIEYQFVDGDKNDSVRLYVNPVKDAPTATIECAYSKQMRQGSRVVSGGANTKADATQIASVDLSQTATTAVGRIYVDEIKVATSWNDLFPAEPSTLIFHETFDYSAGQLSAGRAANCNDSTKWWSVSGWTGSATTPTNPIQVAEGSLSYPGYVTTATNNKAQLDAVSGTIDVRRFVPVTSGSVYAAAIINIEKANSEYIFGLCDGTSSNYTARLYAKSADNGFQLSIAKGAENKANIPYTTATYSYNTDYLVVVEYVFKDGAKNDSVNLWVNPTKSTTTPTLVCDTTLANAKNDMTKIAGVYLRQNKNGAKFTIDEIKVATAWDDLFESDYTPTPSTTPTIAADNVIYFNEGFPYTGVTYTATFDILAEYLTGDVTLTSNNQAVTLSKTTLTKAEAEEGETITATLLTDKAGLDSTKITISSTGAKDEIVKSTWYALALTRCATIAEMNTAAATATDDDYVYIKYTGEAVVTYAFNQGDGNKYYLQDASGAIQVNDHNWTISRGDKLTNFMVYAWAGDKSGGIQPVNTNEKTVTIISHDNEWTPEVVTLEELQTNPANYLLQLITVKGMTFADGVTTFASGITANQGNKSIAINLLTDNNLIGEVVPTKADVTGISSNSDGSVLRVRDKDDVKAVEDGSQTALEAITLDQLTGEYEIYTVSGQRVNALQPGVNIIRQGEKTYKVIR